MRRGLPLLIVLAGFACGKSPEQRWQAREQQREANERYAPPADGRLNQNQLRAYLAVEKERAAARRSSASDPSEGDPFFRPEAASVRKLRLNLEEYLWTKQRIVETEILADEMDARRKNAETYRRTIAALRRAASASADPPTREVLSRQIAELEQEAAENDRVLRRPRPREVDDNLALVGRFRKDIDAARRALSPKP
jgi:hypothetical protein